MCCFLNNNMNWPSIFESTLLFWWSFLTTSIVRSRGPDVFTSCLTFFRNNENRVILLTWECGENDVYWRKHIFLLIISLHNRLTLTVSYDHSHSLPPSWYIQPSETDPENNRVKTINSLVATCYSAGDPRLTPATASHDGARAEDDTERDNADTRRTVWIRRRSLTIITRRLCHYLT